MAFPILAAAIPAVAGLVGGLLTNKANRDMQESTNAMNAREAQLNREFQQMMSNTAHQREVADLRAAGMNPILTATGGAGASTPGGSTATMIAPKATDVIGSAKDSAMAGIAMASNFQNQAADTEVKMEQAKLAASQNASTAKDVERKGIENSFTAATLGQQIKKGELDIKGKGLDVNMSERAFMSRLRQIQNESIMSGSKAVSAENAARYDYETDKMLDKLGMHSSSAKRQDDDSLVKKILDQLHDSAAVGVRRVFRGGGK